MTTRTLATWECYLRNPEYDDETLHIIHDDINAWPEHSDLDPGDMQCYALELIAQVRALTAERDLMRHLLTIAVARDYGAAQWMGENEPWLERARAAVLSDGTP